LAIGPAGIRKAPLVAKVKRDLTIELGRGATYANSRFTVYAHDRYPRHSVLAGQDRRTFLDSFTTVDEAKTVYPDAVVITGSTYAPPYLGHLPDGDY